MITTTTPPAMKKVQLMLVNRRFWFVSRNSPATSAWRTPSFYLFRYCHLPETVLYRYRRE